MEEELQSLGLSKNEAKIYLALAELGLTTIGNVAKKCKLHRTNIYDAVESLMRKGLVSHILQNDVKHYQISRPEDLVDMIHEKEDIAEHLVPRIKLMHEMSNTRSAAQIYVGVIATKRALDRHLDHNKEILVLGAPSNNIGKTMGPFLTNFHKRRIDKKIQMKHIYNTPDFDRIAFLKKLPFTSVRILPSEYGTPATTNIVGDEVSMVMWDDTPTVVIIKSVKLADAYRNYFNILWKRAKPL